MHRFWRVALTLVVMLACMPASALAQRGGSPHIDEPPRLTGTPQVGERIEASDPSWSGARAQSEETHTWLRCTSTSLGDCAIIDGARGQSYTATDADVAQHLRVVLTVVNRHGGDAEVSSPTELISRMPVPPSPASPPPPPPAGSPPPPSDPPAAPASPPGDAVLAERLRLMRPFPVVRVRGFLTSRGAVLSLFTVRTPRATSIVVRCLGRHCPRRAWRRTARRAGVTRVNAFEGSLRAGVRLRIRVTRPGFLGKQTLIRIRRGKAPARRDRCLRPGAGRPTACPAS